MENSLPNPDYTFKQSDKAHVSDALPTSKFHISVSLLQVFALLIFISGIVMFAFYLLNNKYRTLSTQTNESSPINQQASTGSECPSDTKVCNDGSIVRRLAPSCAFALCPEVANPIIHPVECADGYRATELETISICVPDHWVSKESAVTTVKNKFFTNSSISENATIVIGESSYRRYDNGAFCYRSREERYEEYAYTVHTYSEMHYYFDEVRQFQETECDQKSLYQAYKFPLSTTTVIIELNTENLHTDQITLFENEFLQIISIARSTTRE